MPRWFRRRNNATRRRRKEAIKAGKSAREIWPDEPAKAAQKDVDARWTLKIGGKVRHRPDGTPLPMIATPVFGYKSHIGIDRRYGFIRESAVTSAAAPDGRHLKHFVSRENTGSEVWADSAYRSGKNEKWLAERMLTSRIHRRKPAGKPMPRATAQANARKSSIRGAVEHVFAHQKTRFGLFIRTIGLARAEAKLTLANIAYNMDRLNLPRTPRGHGMSPPENTQNGPGSLPSGARRALRPSHSPIALLSDGILRVSSLPASDKASDRDRGCLPSADRTHPGLAARPGLLRIVMRKRHDCRRQPLRVAVELADLDVRLQGRMHDVDARQCDGLAQHRRAHG